MTKVLLTLIWAIVQPSLLAQQFPRINNGTWQFTIGGFATTLQVSQTSPFEFSGQFVSGTGARSAGFTGQTALNRTIDFFIRWDSSNRDVPGVSAGFPYWGNISLDGNSMQGQYGASPSQFVANWSARLITPAPGPGPIQTPAVSGCGLNTVSARHINSVCTRLIPRPVN